MQIHLHITQQPGGGYRATFLEGRDSVGPFCRELSLGFETENDAAAWAATVHGPSSLSTNYRPRGRATVTLCITRPL